MPLDPVQVQAVRRDGDRGVAIFRAANPLEALERAVAAAFEVERVVRVLHRPGRVRAARLKRGTPAVHGPAAVDRPAPRRRELAPAHEDRVQRPLALVARHGQCHAQEGSVDRLHVEPLRRAGRLCVERHQRLERAAVRRRLDDDLLRHVGRLRRRADPDRLDPRRRGEGDDERLREVLRHVDPGAGRLAVDRGERRRLQDGLAGARDDRAAASEVHEAGALRVVVRRRDDDRLFRDARRFRRFVAAAGEEQQEGRRERALHRKVLRSTTIFVTSAILATALPTLRSSDIRFRRTASSSTMTMTSSKKRSSSGAIPANDSRARR